jgi:hypothetical protein
MCCPQLSIASCSTIISNTDSTAKHHLTYTKTQYLISSTDQSQTHPISTTQINNTLQPNPNPTQHNEHAVLRLGTALPRQIHRRILQTRQPSIIPTKNIIACPPDHDFRLHRSPATAQHHYRQDVKSGSTSDEHHVCGPLSEGPRTLL